MALPKLETPLFELTLPSSNKKIQFRGFKVKEEKILLLAQQTEDLAQINLAIKQVITNCTNGTVNPETAPIYDIEYIFLNLIAKSIGEELSLTIACENCKEEIEYKTNIYDIAVPQVIKGADIVKLSDTIGIKLKYPTINTLDYTTAIIDIYGDTSLDAIYNGIIMNAEYIYDEDGTYHLKDQSISEITEFFDSLTLEQLDKIQNFFRNIPAITESIEFTCPHCQHENKYLIKGIGEIFLSV